MSSQITDVLIVGAGPAGSAAATWCARAGLSVLLVDAETFPRDKPCGDGLTPRAIAELDQLGLSQWLEGRARNATGKPNAKQQLGTTIRKITVKK